MAEYDINDLLQRIPEDSADFFIGFSPWPEDCENWRRSVNELFDEGLSRQLRRTVWDDPEDQQARMMIDVVELPSAERAIEALGEALSWNQLAALPEGPDGLGHVSFIHPEAVPPAVFFVQGNLFVSVSSIGTTELDVTAWGSRLVERLVQRPDGARDAIALGADTDRLRQGEPVALNYTLPSRLGEYGFVKIHADGARLSRDDTGALLAATQNGSITVELFAVEPGRETLSGRLTAETP